MFDSFHVFLVHTKKREWASKTIRNSPHTKRIGGRNNTLSSDLGMVLLLCFDLFLLFTARKFVWFGPVSSFPLLCDSFVVVSLQERIKLLLVSGINCWMNLYSSCSYDVHDEFWGNEGVWSENYEEREYLVFGRFCCGELGWVKMKMEVVMEVRGVS
jgi:hypothetical protein